MGFIKTFRSIYKPKYAAINIVTFVLYYFIMRAIILADNPIILFANTFAQYAFYGVAITSSVLITVAIYSVYNTRNNNAKVSATASSGITAVVGSLAVGCGCGFSVLSSLAVLGLSSGEIISLNSVLADYQTPLLILALAANLILIAYYGNKLSKPSCRIKSQNEKISRERRK